MEENITVTTEELQEEIQEQEVPESDAELVQDVNMYYETIIQQQQVANQMDGLIVASLILIIAFALFIFFYLVIKNNSTKYY